MNRGALSFTLIAVIMCTAQAMAEPVEPDCSCVISGWFGDCRIDAAPPKGYQCHCRNNKFWCSGTAIKCDDPSIPQCIGCSSLMCCIGECTGYPKLE